MPLPASVIPADEVALIDATAVDLGHDLFRFMEAAGAALAHEAERLCAAGRVLVACGAGNNGGDGWVAARLLHAAGRNVAVWPVLAPRSDLCQRAAEQARAAGVNVLEGPGSGVTLILDCLLGAGSVGPPRGAIAAAIPRLIALSAPIVAADLPTGLGSELLLPARLTVCFQLAKQELLTDPRIGEFKTVDIGLPPQAWQEVQPRVMRRFPGLRREAHKGVHGEVLLLGGGAFPGALELASRACLATGVDLVRVMTAEGPPLPASIIAVRQPGRYLAPSDPDHLMGMLLRASAVLIGSGLGREPGCAEAARQILELAVEMDVPVVIDADGITALAAAVNAHAEHSCPLLCTPHGGEARTLIGSTDEEAVHAWARPNRVVLRKSRVDFLSDGRRWQRHSRGNPRMAVGGTGDILAGLAAGLVGRGVPVFDAARLAVYWICDAADSLWQEQGPCWRPEDLLDTLPRSLRGLLEPLGHWPPVAE